MYTIHSIMQLNYKGIGKGLLQTTMIIYGPSFATSLLILHVQNWKVCVLSA